MTAIERAILRAVKARNAELQTEGERWDDRDAAAARLARVAVGLVVEAERLDDRRTVRQGARHRHQVVRDQPRPELDGGRGPGRVTRDQRGRDAEALIRLSPPVLDADDGIELADEDRRPLPFADPPLQLGDVDLERVTETEIGAGARHEVDAG